MIKKIIYIVWAKIITIFYANKYVSAGNLKILSIMFKSLNINDRWEEVQNKISESQNANLQKRIKEKIYANLAIIWKKKGL